MAASVKMKHEHGRHVGRDHAGALAEAVDDDRHAADLGRARGELGVGVGGHDGARGRFEGIGLRRLAPAPPADARTCPHPAARRSPPSRRRRPRSAPQPTALAAASAVMRVASLPFLPVKALALPELTTSARALPCSRLCPAPQHRRRAGLGAGQHAGHHGAGVEHGHHQVGAALVADAGLAGRQRTPGTAGISGSRAGANGDSFAAVLAMPRPPRPCALSLRGRYCLAARRSARSPSSALDLRIDVLDLSLAPQVRRRSAAPSCGSWPPPPGP